MNRPFASIFFLMFVFAACGPVKAIPTSTPLPPPPDVEASSTPSLFDIDPGELLPPSPTFTRIPPSTNYQLKTWTAQDADQLIGQVASDLQATENDPMFGGTYGYEGYMMQYDVLAFVEAEALMRFPDAPQAEKWRWDLCYNLAFSDMGAESDTAPELPCYARLMQDGLNTGKTTPAQFVKWFETHENRFPIEIKPNTPPAGYQSSHLIVLENNAIFWLLEKNGVFQVTGLRSSMFFFRETWAGYQLTDLTGDQIPELILNFGRSHCCGAASMQFVYEISTGTPRLLTFLDKDGEQTYLVGESDSLIMAQDAGSPSGLVFKSNFGDSSVLDCSLLQYERYLWTGSLFEWVESWHAVAPPDQYDDKELCDFAIQAAANPAELSVIAKNIQQRQVSSPDYQVPIYFGLGEHYLLEGDHQQASHYFSQTLEASEGENSGLKEAARLLMESKTPLATLYAQCGAIPGCGFHGIFQALVKNIPPASFGLAAPTLQEQGVQIKAQGAFDFDEDGRREQWLVIQHPQQTPLEFWVLVNDPAQLQALFVAEVTTNQPEIQFFSNLNESGRFALNGQAEKSLYMLRHLPISKRWYLASLEESKPFDPTVDQTWDEEKLWEQSVNAIEEQIFAGQDLTAAKQTLLSMIRLADVCEKYGCIRLYYLLGLTNELLGDQPAARDAYWQVWDRSPTSFYATMARYKLQALP